MRISAKIITLLLAIVLLLGFASCEDAGKGTVINTTPTVDDIMKAGETEGAAADTEQQTEDETYAVSPVTDVDVDLTVLNSTMVYSEVYDMVTYPETYTGKSVRMKGTFAMQFGDERNYYAVLIKDATACCAQGIEFVLEDADSLSFPEDYPTVGHTVTVVGTFDTYVEGEYTYCELIDAHFE